VGGRRVREGCVGCVEVIKGISELEGKKRYLQS
jgi:hypothetical protein